MKYSFKLLEKLGRKRVIMDRYENEPIQHVTILKDRKKFPNVFLHKFHKGDLDDLHDPSYLFTFTLIQKVDIGKHTPEGKFWRGPGSFRFSTSKSLHRIELESM